MGRNTMTALFEERSITSAAIATELQRLGDSKTVDDCRMRNCLLEILQLRRELTEEREVVNTLEEFGLQTTGSIYGVHLASSPPDFRRKWICWQGQRHSTLREAVREAIQIRKGKKKGSK